MRGIQRRPVDSPHKGPVTWKMFDDVIMCITGIFTIIIRSLSILFQYNNVHMNMPYSVISSTNNNRQNPYIFSPWCFIPFRQIPNPWVRVHIQLCCLRWRHQMETFSALLAICAGNSPVPVNSPHKGQWHDVFFDLSPNKRLSKQWWGWWFETPSSPLWRHCNAMCHLVT